MIETETQYFDLTPRKRALIFDASQELGSPGDVGEKPDRASPPFVTETSKRGRALGRRGVANSGSPALNKENVGPVRASPEGGKAVLTKAALKRQQVVNELSQAQADARSRLCIFKKDGEAGEHERDSEPTTGQAVETSVGGSRAGSHAGSHGHCAALTVPQGPTLRTAVRSSSRSQGCDGRSFSTPLRGVHSVGEPELSHRSRGTSRERVGTPEQSVRSMRSMRSVRSMQSVKLSTSVFSASLAGRSLCTRPLTFPQGPNLATEARSRSHSVGARTPAGTPERHCRSVSMHSTRSLSRTPSQYNLTVPQAPVLATELRSRSRSVGTRTPSAHSVGTPERSVRSCRTATTPNGPLLSTSLRSRSHSVNSCAPHSTSAKKFPTEPLRPHRPRGRSHSVDMRMPSYSGTLTIAKGPVLSTDLRSRSRQRTPSVHSVGTPERSVRSCLSRDSFRSCASVRDSSVCSLSRSQPRPLTVPVGPLLATQVRSSSRSHRGCLTNVAGEQETEPPIATESSGRTHGSDAQPEITDPPCKDMTQQEQSDQPSEAAEDQCEELGPKQVHGLPDEAEVLASDESSKEQAGVVASGESPKEQEVRGLLDYLPTPERHATVSGKRETSGPDATSSAESRAASRKQQVLAKVAEEHANIRKQRFVFSRPGTTPTRTPLRSKAELNSGETPS